MRLWTPTFLDGFWQTTPPPTSLLIWLPCCSQRDVFFIFFFQRDIFQRPSSPLQLFHGIQFAFQIKAKLLHRSCRALQGLPLFRLLWCLIPLIYQAECILAFPLPHPAFTKPLTLLGFAYAVPSASRVSLLSSLGSFWSFSSQLYGHFPGDVFWMPWPALIPLSWAFSQHRPQDHVVRVAVLRSLKQPFECILSLSFVITTRAVSQVISQGLAECLAHSRC